MASTYKARVLALGHVFLLKGFCTAGCLAALQYALKPSRCNVRRFLFQQLVLAVDFLHKLGMACKDLRPEHLLIGEKRGRPRLKLCDFGFSRPDDESTYVLASVGDYWKSAAPELLHTHLLQYSKEKLDVWSCGVILYMLLTMQHPFDTPHLSDLEIRQEIFRGRFRKLDGVSPECRWVTHKELLIAARTVTPVVSSGCIRCHTVLASSF